MAADLVICWSCELVVCCRKSIYSSPKGKSSLDAPELQEQRSWWSRCQPTAHPGCFKAWWGWVMGISGDDWGSSGERGGGMWLQHIESYFLFSVWSCSLSPQGVTSKKARVRIQAFNRRVAYQEVSIFLLTSSDKSSSSPRMPFKAIKSSLSAKTRSDFLSLNGHSETCWDQVWRLGVGVGPELNTCRILYLPNSLLNQIHCG